MERRTARKFGNERLIATIAVTALATVLALDLFLFHVPSGAVMGEAALTAFLLLFTLALVPPNSPRATPRPAPLIALVGSDGAGKSAVGAELLAWMRETQAAELRHLGKQSGNIGRAIARWPLIGREMDRALEGKVKEAGAGRGPGPIASLMIFGFTLRRVSRFRRMVALRNRGVAILSDRFPQLSIPRGLDGPGFAKVRMRNGFTRALARCELRHFRWMTMHVPDLVIRLNVDLATAIARKPDHRPSALANKLADVPRLTFNGAPIVEIDAALPLADVVASAKRAIMEVLREREPFQHASPVTVRGATLGRKPAAVRADL